MRYDNFQIQEETAIPRTMSKPFLKTSPNLSFSLYHHTAIPSPVRGCESLGPHL